VSSSLAKGFGRTATSVSVSRETADASHARATNLLQAGFGSGAVMCTSTFPSSTLTG
jgi:hypothetical protein